MDNIFPEAAIPKQYVYLGDMRNRKLNLCVDTEFDKGGTLHLKQCNLDIETVKYVTFNQLFLYNMNDQIVNDEKCLNVDSKSREVQLKKCSNNANEKWDYTDELQLIHYKTNMCLDVNESDQPLRLILGGCEGDSETQQWVVEDNFLWQAPNHF